MTDPFHVLIPARLASTRLPRQAAGRHRRRADGRARRAAGRALERRAAWWWPPTTPTSSPPARAHGVEALLTRADHASGSDRLAEACALLGLDGDAHRRQRAGRRAADRPALIDACAPPAREPRRDCVMSTAAHAIDDAAEFAEPERREGGARRAPGARCTSRARRFPGWRDARAPAPRGCRQPRAAAPRRPLRLPRRLPAPLSAAAAAARSKRSKRSSSCACCGTASASRCMSATTRPGPASTRRTTWSGCAPCSRLTRCGVLPERLRDRPQGTRTDPPDRPFGVAAPTLHEPSEDTDETDPVGRPGAGKGTQAAFICQQIRHPADLHRRHAARRRQGRHAARPGGQEGDGRRRAWSATTSSSAW